MTKRSYTSLQDWMERTGTPQVTLAALANVRQPHLSKILSRSRRCSIEVALRLSQVTGVPVEKLVDWGKRARRARTDRAFKTRAA